MTNQQTILAGSADERLRDGFFANQIKSNYRNLRRMIGFEAARQIAFDIIADDERRTTTERKEAL